MTKPSLVFAAIAAFGVAGCMTETATTTAPTTSATGAPQATSVSEALMSQAEAKKFLETVWIGTAQVEHNGQAGYFSAALGFSKIVRGQISGEMAMDYAGRVTKKRFRGAATRAGNTLDIVIAIPADFQFMFGKQWRVKYIAGSDLMVGQGAAGEVRITPR